MVLLVASIIVGLAWMATALLSKQKATSAALGFSSLFVVIMLTGGLCANGDVVVARSHQGAASDSADDQNPYSYIYGSVTKRDMIRDDKGQDATNITFQPRYTSEVFTKSVLFCGDRTDAFNKVDGPIVVTYKRVPHRMVEGVPCFDLVSVDHVESRRASWLRPGRECKTVHYSDTASATGKVAAVVTG